MAAKILLKNKKIKWYILNKMDQKCTKSQYLLIVNHCLRSNKTMVWSHLDLFLKMATMLTPIEKQKGVRFLELEPDWSVNKWSTIFNNSGITEGKLVGAKDTGTVFGMVDTPLSLFAYWRWITCLYFTLWCQLPHSKSFWIYRNISKITLTKLQC